MAPTILRANWEKAHSSAQGEPPQARCGHVAAAVYNDQVWNEEFVIVHGGINGQREALDDLVVLASGGAWFRPAPSALGPAARAFHCAAAVGRSLYVFGGHVFVRQQSKIHHFGDLWRLDTDSWEWSRVEFSPDAPAPCPRDRASLVALDDSRLLLSGGADAGNRRLDDLWTFSLAHGAWEQLSPAGPRPRARCCAALASLGPRVLLFGGDTSGASGDLWSLRLEKKGSSWTPLQLPGAAPGPRRGHAVAALRGQLVFQGGVSEQRGMLGLVSKASHLADVAVLSAGAQGVEWRLVEGGGGEVDAKTEDQSPSPAAGLSSTLLGPPGREKHSLTALSDGRIFLFGGTDGAATLGDAWWLRFEEAPLSAGGDPRAPSLPSQSSGEEALQQALEQSRMEQQMEQLQTIEASVGNRLVGLPPTDKGAASARGTPPPARGPLPRAPSPPASQPLLAQSATRLAASLAAFPALPAALPAVPLGLSSAFGQLRERLGLPGGAGAAALAPLGVLAAEYDPDLLRLGDRVMQARGAANLAGSGSGGMPLNQPDCSNFAAASNPAKASPAPPASALGSASRRARADAARAFLGSCALGELRMGDLGALLADYKQWARVGWRQAAGAGPEALEAALAAGKQSPGRFLHSRVEDLRVGDVPALVEEYRALVAGQLAERASA